jgi:membrane-bound lytic murein transglycosylase D
LLLALLIVSCAHKPAVTPDGKSIPDTQMMSSGDEDPSEGEGPSHGPEDEAPLQVGKAMPRNADLSDAETDMLKLPEDFNQNVNMWIEYFQGRGRVHMVRYLGRSTRYLPKMKEILKKHGLPEDLVYLALIESGFNAQAFSHARASGYWQFIRGTARRYDLKIDYYTDERSDFVASTEAAAQYLKALYHLFGSWYLAIASYNVGENKVKNLVMKYYTRDFWELARKKKLPKETINYVPKFLAARMIAKHPEKYGFTDVEYQPPLNFQEITFDKSVSLTSLAQNLGVSYEELHSLNPAFKKGVVPKYDGQNVVVRVPTSLNKDQVLLAMENSSTAVAVAQTVSQAEENEYVRYRIRSGDTLSTIARRFRVSMATLIDINDLSRRTVLRVGRTLRIPKNSRSVSSSSKNTSSSTTSKQKQASKWAKQLRFEVKREPVKQKVHVVKRGETLLNIANRYNIRMSKLIAANKLRQSEKILVGSRLKIPR